MRIEFSVDLSDLEFDINKLEKAISEEIEQTAYKIERTAKELVPVDTGTLRRSITTEGVNLEYDVFTNVEYAHYMEYGTSPHRIEGRPYLFWDGATHPIKSVMHPGTKPYLYITTAFDEHTKTLDTRIAEIIEDVL